MNIGILGANGLVGQEMLKCLEEGNININNLSLFGNSSINQKLKYKGQDIAITKPNFKGLDYLLGACNNEVTKSYIDDIKKAGVIFIDNSSAFRLNEDVPLIIPEINPEDLKHHNGIIANPNCSTIITLMAINPINKLSKVTGLYASTYQAVSGAGKKGLDELETEISKYQKDSSINKYSNAFEKPIAFNVLAKIGDYKENNYTSEEMKMENEGRKILHLPNLKVSCTCIRVPVLRSHTISVSVITENILDIKQVKEEIQKTKGLRLIEEPDYPTPLQSSNKPEVLVGRIRKDRVNETGLSLVCCGDQILKGAAYNAIQILETLINNK